MDVDIIIKMGFFMGDLHRHIEQLHEKQFNGQNSDKSFTVYRGQGMFTADFEQMTKTKVGLISFNNFLSTSKNRIVSLLFAESNQSNPDLIEILFVLTIDPSKCSTPFASIDGVSHFQVEEEVLFSMHTVFRICDIKPMDENHRLFQVELALTSDNDKDLRALTDRIRKETFPNDGGWYRVGLLLLQIGQSDKAEEVYEILLKQTTNENEKSGIYHRLGKVKSNQGEYKDAITLYEKSIEVLQKVIPVNNFKLATSTVTLGNVHLQLGEHQKALSLYEKALQIYQKLLSPNHPDLAYSYDSISNVYYKMGEYSKALSSYEKALKIQQQSLSPNHPDLASSYNNIGWVYGTTGDYSKARLFYERAVDIEQQSLPSNHPNLQLYKRTLDRIQMNL